MNIKRILSLLIALTLLLGIFAGCNTAPAPSTSETPATTPETPATPETPETALEDIDLEIWSINSGYLPIEKGSPKYDQYKELFGVGIIQPYVEWNGGETYQQQLNLKIAAGEMPDMFIAVNGMESSLAKSGAILEIGSTLAEKSPTLWNTIPKEAWNIVKSYDPNDAGGIYFVPSVLSYTLMSGLIRQDWLDNLGLDMPTTQEEYVNVLRAFRDDDPNGNGIADEIPTGGRQEARWMDHLFAMYGVAMWEGFPAWDTYDGELTYSAVTPNMRAAIEWNAMLYEEGLIDPETFLNDKAAWDGKVTSNQVGVYYHWTSAVNERLELIEASAGVKADIAVLPPISAPGFEGFYTNQTIKVPLFVIKNQPDQARVDACFKVLEGFGNPAIWDELYYGIEGVNYEEVDGRKEFLPEDKTKQQNSVFVPFLDIATLDYRLGQLEDSITPTNKWGVDQGIRNLKDVQQYGKLIAGDGIPASIYEDYPDIQSRTLYVECVSKIITGEWPIEKFDEFVEQWYATGGDVVTERAREWHTKVGK